MGKSSNPATDVINQAKNQYQQNTSGPTPTMSEFIPFSQGMNNNYQNAVAQNTKDYGNIMGAYSDFRNNLPGATKFSYQNVSANRPAELGTAYSDIQGAMPGYQNFANTGGYSDQDVQNLRERGISPIRSAYGDTMMQLDRARALGGNGGAPNYIAAVSKAQRQLPGQLADAMTNVNAGLAESIRAGKEFGLQGQTATGQAMGSLSSAEAGRQLQAALANQAADIQTQGMGESSLQNRLQNQLTSMGGQAGLYGTSPGMASTFGNQALQSYGQRFGADTAMNQYNLGLMNAQLQGYNQQPPSGWQTALGIGSKIAPFALAPFTGGMSLMGAPLSGMFNQSQTGTPSMNYTQGYPNMGFTGWANGDQFSGWPDYGSYT